MEDKKRGFKEGRGRKTREEVDGKEGESCLLSGEDFFLASLNAITSLLYVTRATAACLAAIASPVLAS